VNIVLKSPRECSFIELQTFENLVSQGGQVSQEGLSSRIQNAKTLAFAYAGENIVGIAAIKVPVTQYKDSVFDKAGILNLRELYDFELGWVYIQPEYHKGGLGYQMVDALLGTDGIFATARTDNMGMNALLFRAGFKRLGSQYQGRGDYEIQVWGI